MISLARHNRCRDAAARGEAAPRPSLSLDIRIASGNDHAARETEADAAVRLEVPRSRRPRVPRQVVWRGDDHAAHLLADAHRDHVALDTLPGADSRIEATSCAATMLPRSKV